MYNLKDFTTGALIGLILAFIFASIILSGFYKNCKYCTEATKLDLVKKKHAEWRTLGNGTVKWKLIKIKE